MGRWDAEVLNAIDVIPLFGLGVVPKYPSSQALCFLGPAGSS